MEQTRKNPLWWFEPTPEQIAGYESWVAERPDAVREVAKRFQPWGLYKHKETGQRVTIVSFGEPEEVGGKVTLRVNVLAKFNPEGLLFDRQVFGCDPDVYMPCAVPAEEGEPAFTGDEVVENIDAFRALAGIPPPKENPHE